mmetsp:Transcript_24983/g.73623  ORF Transcript_24983/g.73623 Transcript_24983/m.73623 type:complete len:450 (-) Transcript_24983:72-1421(-)
MAPTRRYRQMRIVLETAPSSFSNRSSIASGVAPSMPTSAIKRPIFRLSIFRDTGLETSVYRASRSPSSVCCLSLRDVEIYARSRRAGFFFQPQVLQPLIQQRYSQERAAPLSQERHRPTSRAPGRRLPGDARLSDLVPAPSRWVWQGCSRQSGREPPPELVWVGGAVVEPLWRRGEARHLVDGKAEERAAVASGHRRGGCAGEEGARTRLGVEDGNLLRVLSHKGRDEAPEDGHRLGSVHGEHEAKEGGVEVVREREAGPELPRHPHADMPHPDAARVKVRRPAAEAAGGGRAAVVVVARVLQDVQINHKDLRRGGAIQEGIHLEDVVGVHVGEPIAVVRRKICKGEQHVRADPVHGWPVPRLQPGGDAGADGVGAHLGSPRRGAADLLLRGRQLPAVLEEEAEQRPLGKLVELPAGLLCDEPRGSKRCLLLLSESVEGDGCGLPHASR